MPLTMGFNHVATVTADLDRVVAFYRTVFDASATSDAHDDVLILTAVPHDVHGRRLDSAS